MIEIPKDAPGKAACGRSGLPLLVRCACGHECTAPFLKLKTHNDDETPLYGRNFKCQACGERGQVTLFALETQAELTAFRMERARWSSPVPLRGHSTPGGSKG